MKYNILRNLLYIFQLEHYDREQFLQYVYKNKNWFLLSKRGKIEMTLRARLLEIISFSIIFFDLAFSWIFFKSFLPLFIYLIIFIPFIPIFLIFVDFLISPIVRYQKRRIMNRAREIIKNAKKSGVKIVGITGSFGKTTMKNVVSSILSEKYATLMIPGNINTDIGVAYFILKNREKIQNIEIIISEMGAYKIDEIENICKIVPPDFSIMTAVAEIHLERFGSLENIGRAKFELANNTSGTVFLNGENKNLLEFKEKYFNGNAECVVVKNEIIEKFEIKENFEGIAFWVEGEKYETKYVAEYILDFFAIGIELGKKFGLSTEEVKKGVENLDFTKHRLEIIRNEELKRVIIDDSYNGNFDGFMEGLKILSRAKGRKIVVTPGIVELGERSEEIHRKLAREYIERVDFILLIKNKNSEYIEKEFLAENFQNFKMYNSAENAHRDFANILQNGDTILFQNDITDNYS